MKANRASPAGTNRGLVRAHVRRGVRSQRASAAARRPKRSPGQEICERCYNVYRDKRWMAPTATERAWPIGFSWTICPACRQVAAGEFFGRVLIRGRKALENEDAISARIENVATRARFTQPQRRIVWIERCPGEIEVLTTSQKLAHRIVAALLQAFGGKARFGWSPEDGELRATWTWGENSNQ